MRAASERHDTALGEHTQLKREAETSKFLTMCKIFLDATPTGFSKRLILFLTRDAQGEEMRTLGERMMGMNKNRPIEKGQRRTVQHERRMSEETDEDEIDDDSDAEEEGRLENKDGEDEDKDQGQTENENKEEDRKTEAEDKENKEIKKEADKEDKEEDDKEDE
ncbi:hypothetical protein G7046_g9725 [Stylonectria norvegica]|nr:hypothetical protein G7046_g9725 [Stylonectria norvegica]